QTRSAARPLRHAARHRPAGGGDATRARDPPGATTSYTRSARRSSSSAAVSPARPAPTTMTSYVAAGESGAAGGGTLGLRSAVAEDRTSVPGPGGSWLERGQLPQALARERHVDC